MAPPRLQCLKAVKQVAKSRSRSAAEFSTSGLFHADGPLRPTASSKLLSSVIDASPSSQESSESRPSFENPIRTLRQLKAGNSTSTDRVMNLISKAEARKGLQRQWGSDARSSNDLSDVEDYRKGQDMSKQITRRFKPGDVYAPHDLSDVEMAKWRRPGKPNYDAFDVLNLNPMDHYRNFSIMSEYMTPMGRIKGSKDTGLRPVNQRRIARAIRRAVGLGIMPSVHRHPEILYKTMAGRSGLY